MAFSGGVFSLVAGNPVTTGTTISSTIQNNTLSDIATGLSTCVLKDGSQTITANIPMSSFKFTGLSAGSAAGNSVRYEQVFTTTALTDQATITWDASLAPVATVTLGASRILAAPSNLKTGGTYSLIVTQDGTGGRQLTWNAVFKAQGGATMPQPAGKASSITAFVFVSPDATNLQLVSQSAQPTVTVLVSGSSATYTTPAGAKRIKVRMVGGGGGGGGATANNGTLGNDTTFGTLTAAGGGAGVANGAGNSAGGASTNGDINITGTGGATGAQTTTAGTLLPGGFGGASVFGGGGAPTIGAQGGNGTTSSGSGGAGGGANSGTFSGGGGGAGGYCEKLIVGPAATYTYTVGSTAAGGSAGTQAGGSGAAGLIIIDEFYD